MVVEGATWVQQRYENQFGFVQYFALRISEDTLIGGIGYRKLYSFPMENDEIKLKDKFLAGFLREDIINRKVFFRSTSWQSVICNEAIGNEVLLYDFSVQIGEPTHTCFNNNADRPDTVSRISYVENLLDIPVFGVDSMMVVELGDTSFVATGRMYFEMVGDVFGILRHAPQTPGYDFGFVDRGLVKYCRHDSLCGVSITTSLEDHLLPTPRILISPNVVSPGQLIPLRNAQKRVTLISSAGREVNMLEDRNMLAIPRSLSSGIYFLKGIDMHGRAYFQKLLVH